MTKKRLLIITLIAGFIFSSFFALASCNKDDAIPTVKEELMPESVNAPYLVCPYCNGRIYQGETHVHLFQHDEACSDSSTCDLCGETHEHIVSYPGAKFWHLGGWFHG